MIERWAIWLFAAANVLLYASVLPLWEGFDEPFHYAYVQYLRTQWEFPVTGKATLSEEVWRSLHNTPGSYLVKRNLPFVESFDDWFRRGGPPDATPPGDQRKLIPEALNYEAQQAPMAYAMLAIPDMLLSGVNLPLRIWMLRVFAGGMAIALFVTALMRLTPSPAAWFCALCVQMLYATTVHVANDWLAVGLAAWFVVACVEERPWLASVILTLGLLTKAYFLAFVPIGVFVCRRRPVALLAILAVIPWYARNWILYGNISGVFISTPKMSFWQTAGGIDWIAWWNYILHAGIWTANNSFTSFSSLTISALLLIVAAGIGSSVSSGLERARNLYFTAVIIAVLAVLAYSTITLRAYTGGETTGTGPWYMPALYAPLFGLAFIRMPRALSAAAVLISAYIVVTTYWLKLIPMYAGFLGRSTFPAMLAWYGTAPHTPAYLARSSIVYLLACAVTVLAGILCGRLTLEELRPSRATSSRTSRCDSRR